MDPSACPRLGFNSVYKSIAKEPGPVPAPWSGPEAGPVQGAPFREPRFLYRAGSRPGTRRAFLWTPLLLPGWAPIPPTNLLK